MAPRMTKAVNRGNKDTNRKERSDRRGWDKKATGKVRRTTREKVPPGRTTKTRRNRPRYRGRPAKGTQVKLRGWLATPADWTRFNNWASVNAQPRKIPEPEPIVRRTKPLSKLKKRLVVLAQPPDRPDPSIHCNMDQNISKAALNASSSYRTKLLALPIVRPLDYGRVFYQISPAALTYEASSRILALSQPPSSQAPNVPEECKPPKVDRCQPQGPDEDRLKRLAMKRKLLHCPDQLTPEELEELFTPYGIRRSALKYKMTPWLEFLTLPPYKTIKRRKTEPAATWKRTIIYEPEKRGKEALVEQLKQRAIERREEKRLKLLKMKEEQEREMKRKKAEEERREQLRRKFQSKEKSCEELMSDLENEVTEECEEIEREKEAMEQRKDAGRRRRGKKRKKKARDGTGDDGDGVELTEEEKKAEEQRQKERWKRKHGWRFAPYPYIDDPFIIKKTALEFEASPRMAELAKPLDRKDRAVRTDPYHVKKAALSATASGRVESLAKPLSRKARSPVERQPPREKDEFGKPIFVMPVYGKVLPKTKPYKMGECPPEEDEEEKKKKAKAAKKRPIDPIAWELTYDPCIYPDLAKRQKIERRRAAKLSPKKKSKRKRRRKDEGQKQEDKAKEEEGQQEGVDEEPSRVTMDIDEDNEEEEEQ